MGWLGRVLLAITYSNNAPKEVRLLDIADILINCVELLLDVLIVLLELLDGEGPPQPPLLNLSLLGVLARLVLFKINGSHPTITDEVLVEVDEIDRVEFVQLNLDEHKILQPEVDSISR